MPDVVALGRVRELRAVYAPAEGARQGRLVQPPRSRGPPPSSQSTYTHEGRRCTCGHIEEKRRAGLVDRSAGLAPCPAGEADRRAPPVRTVPSARPPRPLVSRDPSSGVEAGQRRTTTPRDCSRASESGSSARAPQTHTASPARCASRTARSVRVSPPSGIADPSASTSAQAFSRRHVVCRSAVSAPWGGRSSTSSTSIHQRGRNTARTGTARKSPDAP